MSAAHEGELRRRDRELAAASSEAESRAAAARQAADAAQGDLSRVLDDCRALKASFEQAM
jgi:hypothetical protein